MEERGCFPIPWRTPAQECSCQSSACPWWRPKKPFGAASDEPSDPARIFCLQKEPPSASQL